MEILFVLECKIKKDICKCLWKLKIFRKRMVIKLDNKRTTNGTIVEQGK